MLEQHHQAKHCFISMKGLHWGDSVDLLHHFTEEQLQRLKETPQQLSSIESPETLSPQEMETLLTEHLACFYSETDQILSTSKGEAINSHGLQHIEQVHLYTQQLLTKAGYNNDNGLLTDATVAAYFHDVFNVISRDLQAPGGRMLVRSCFPQYPFLRRKYIERAVMYHGSGNLEQLIQEEKNRTSILNKMSPIVFALNAADKLDLGRTTRFPQGTSYPSSLEHVTAHTYIGSLLTKNLGYSVTPDSFEWKLQFNNSVSTEEANQNPRLQAITNNGHIIYPVENGQDPFQKYVEQFNTLFGDRNRMAMKSLFILFPKIKTARIVLTDSREQQEEIAIEYSSDFF